MSPGAADPPSQGDVTGGALPQASVTRSLSRWRNFLGALIVLLALEASLAAVIRLRVLSDLFSGDQLGLLQLLSSLGLLLLVPIVYAIVQARRAQQELHLLVQTEQESLNTTRTLLDTTTEGIFAIDETGVCTMANRAAGELLGYAPAELLGRHMHDLIHHSHEDSTAYPVKQCPIFQAMARQETRSVDDEAFWRKDGRPLSVAYSSVPIVNGDRVTGAVVSFRDIQERKIWERATEEADQRTRIFLHDLPLGVFITDEDGHPIYSNRWGVELLGLPADPSLEGADLSQAYQVYVAGTDDLYDPARLPVARAVAGETVTVDDIEIRRPDGSTVPLEVWASPIRDDEGTIRYAAATFSDISARKRAAAELQRQAEMLDLVEDAVIALDMSNRITYWNRTAASIYGWTKQEALGKISFELLQTTFPDSLEKIKRALLEEGRWEGELGHTRKDGDPILVASRWVLRRDNAGRPAQILEVNNDITEQKRAEHERLRQQQLLSAILETSPDIIALISSELELTYVNAAAQTILGYEFAELFGENSLHWVHADDLEAAARLLQSAFEAGETGSSRLRVKNAAGEWIWLDIRIQAMGGARDSAVVMARDVTDQVELEEGLKQARTAADEANVAKSDFLSRMSHELRTPLNAVLGFAQLLDLDAGSPLEKEATGEILKAGQHLLNLINEVLDIAAIEARRLPLSLEPVDVFAVAQECISLLRPLATEEGITFQLDQDDVGTPRYAVADRQRLKQVLLNLISNAIKYNRERGYVVVSFLVDESDRIGVQLSDTGRGIAPDKLPQLFVPFDRLGAEGSHIEGTGLGLALSKSLVEAMGGTLSVSSELGEGTTALVFLDRATEVEQHPEPTDSAAPAGQRTSTRSKTVVYIEDNLSNVKLVERLIARRPHMELLPAMQGRLGLSLARKHHPDLILLDVNLPDMSGLEVLRRLKADPQTAGIPVVMLSADGTAGQITRLREAGASEYLTKPIDIHLFYQVIDQIDLDD